MQHDANLHYLNRIAVATEMTATASSRSAREVVRVRRQLKDMFSYIKRAALLAALYGSGLTLLLLSQEKAQLLADIIKAVR